MASSNQNVIYDITRYLKRAFKIGNNPNEEISHGTMVRLSPKSKVVLQ